MQTLNQLLKKEIINDLVFRAILSGLTSGEILNIDDAAIKYNIKKEDIQQTRSEIFNLAIHSTGIYLDFDLLSKISEADIRKYKLLPLLNEKENKNVKIFAILDPELENVLKYINDISIKYDWQYELYLINKEQYEEGLEKVINSDNNQNKITTKTEDSLILSDVSSSLNNLDKKEAEYISDDTIDLENYKDRYNEVPIEKLVNSILDKAISSNASDIHIENIGAESRVRLRIDGTLQNLIVVPEYIHSSLIARIKILSDMKLDEKRKPQDGRFSIRVKNNDALHKIDFRVSTMPSYYAEKVVMRILDSYRGVKKLEDVGFSEKHLGQIRKALERPYGMIIVSGPTGSGKTTTLYSMLNELDKEKRNVVSLEDPIEYNIPSMNQSQIFPEIGYDFATGLRSILRQDPDIIMVGEIRDKETAELAIQAALTGHLVFTTIHTNNSIGVITRLIDIGIEPYLIAPTIVLSIAQRLTPKIHPSSASPVEMTPAIKNLIDHEFADLPDEYKKDLNLNQPLQEALPNEMSLTGTKGRMPVLEILEFDNEVQQAVLTNKSEEEVLKIARSKGMLTMKQDAILKSMRGDVPFVEINGL
jgi:type II secretory ATPase GspE/PulE/Tfp pilus assembly ATPase PilB-like protein